MLEVADSSGTAYSHSPGGSVDAVGFKLAQVNCQALLFIPQSSGVPMAPTGGEKGDLLGYCKFDLRKQIRRGFFSSLSLGSLITYTCHYVGLIRRAYSRKIGRRVESAPT